MDEEKVIIIEGKQYTVSSEVADNIHKLLNGTYKKEIIAEVIDDIKQTEEAQYKKLNKCKANCLSDWNTWDNVKIYEGGISAVSSFVKELIKALKKRT